MQGKCETMYLHAYFDWWERRDAVTPADRYLKDWHCAQLLKDRPVHATFSLFGHTIHCASSSIPFRNIFERIG